MMELFLGIAEVKGQVPFIQVNQVPLLLNPSLSGSKEKKRVAIGLNNYHFYTNKPNSYYLSYDQMVQKIGSGVGGYIMHQSFRSSPLNSEIANTLSPVYNNKYFSSSSETSLGLMIAPKYRVGTQQQPKYTFSPSFMIGYSYRDQEQYHRSNQTYGYSYSYYSWFPYGNGVNSLDSLLYTVSKISTHLLRSGIGLELNSESLMILYKATVDLENSKETSKILSVSNSTEQQSVKNYYFKQHIYSLEQSLTIGKTFSSSTKNFSFSPVIGFGIRTYLNVDQSSLKRLDYNYHYSQNIITKANHINYIHASLNFRVKKILFGVASTYHPKFGLLNGVTLGYQNSKMKVMSTWGINNGRINSEVTVNVFF